jgi:hypothetical protein
MTAAVDLETRALTLADEAREWRITDQQTYKTAAERLLAVAALRREIIAHHEPVMRATHQAWQRAIEAERKMLDPVTEAEGIYKDKITDYTAEQRRLEAEAQAAAEAEARRLAEQIREKELEQAEAEGATGEEIASMIAEPLPVTIPKPQRAFQPARGITTATSWYGEVTSLEALIKAVAENKASTNLLMPNQVAIGELARATRGTLEVPGIRFFKQSVVRAGRR